MQTGRHVLGYGLVLALAAAGAGWGAVPRDFDPGAAADRARTKIVVLKMRQEAGQGSATGFLARPRLVVTAGHAVRNTGAVTAWLNGVAYGTTVLLVHPQYDLAVLGLRSPDLLLKPLELAPSAEDLAEGEPLMILAGPSQPPAAKGEPRDRVEIPASYRRRVGLRGNDGSLLRMLGLDASVRLGDSGSPVLRLHDGRAVGVLCSREAPGEGGVSRTAYAAPIEALNPWLDQAAERLRKLDGDFYLLPDR